MLKGHMSTQCASQLCLVRAHGARELWLLATLIALVRLQVTVVLVLSAAARAVKRLPGVICDWQTVVQPYFWNSYKILHKCMPIKL